MELAFIGLGNMGGPMASNLVKAGHTIIAFDMSEAAKAKAIEFGCKVAENIPQAVKGAQAVVSMLPTGKHVFEVYAGANGLHEHLPEGALLIDCSTIDIETARRIIGISAERGFEMVDAPVSGGVAAAAAGTLTFMVGGTDAGFERARPILEVMGKNIFHAGAAGNGQVAKICNNMILGVTMISTCEAFNLAERLGLDAQTFYDISSTASGQSWSMTSYCPAPGPVPSAPSNRDYAPGFSVAMMLKDMRLSQEAAHSAKAPTPLGAQAEALYALMEAAGDDGLDFSGVMKLISGK